MIKFTFAFESEDGGGNELVGRKLACVAGGFG